MSVYEAWAQDAQSVASTAQTDTKAKTSKRTTFLDGWEVNVDTTAATTDAVAVTVSLDGTVIYTGAIPASSAVGFRLGIVYASPLRTSGDIVLSVGDPGGTAIFNLNMWGKLAP